MSGDAGLHEQPIVFYHEEMTEAKKIILRHKEIKLAYLDEKLSVEKFIIRKR